MYNAEETHEKLKAKQEVTPREFVHFLNSNKHALLAWCIENNAGNINNTLRHQLGYSELSFEPNHKKIARIISMIIDTDNKKELHAVLHNFQLKEENLSPELIRELKLTFSEN
jgi:hypothetical protein